MTLRILHLKVNGEYFDETKDETKKFENRLKTEYWKKRLVGRTYDLIYVKKGYPKNDDTSRILVRPWRGYEVHTKIHKHFGPNPVEVFAIRVNE
jgi:hypothetical protein